MNDRGGTRVTEIHDNEREEISTVVTFGINHMKDVAKFLQKKTMIRLFNQVSFSPQKSTQKKIK